MDSSQTLALAQKFQEAADDIRQSKQLLENRLKAVGSGWQGEARNKFDQSFEETVARYDQFEKDLLETSQELRDAAVKIEERKADIARMEELERKRREERREKTKKGDA
ncbi:WXG100 family type VII secretion target [Bacillus pumilus]|uniref:ESAT-6-like protein n=1 Tax=Bacillus pumilus TaxID=1408 RepID=A0A2A5INL1_BACPU|nr:WXG100 family type VII secretion target [Bacillus pumilus]PCK18910.1 WXG100 family type VII secretion target [Bacillus pumilus]